MDNLDDKSQNHIKKDIISSIPVNTQLKNNEIKRIKEK